MSRSETSDEVLTEMRNKARELKDEAALLRNQCIEMDSLGRGSAQAAVDHLRSLTDALQHDLHTRG